MNSSEPHDNPAHSSDANPKGVFYNLVANNPDPILIVDKFGIIKFCNNAAEILFCRERADIIEAGFGFPIITDKKTEIQILHPLKIHTAEMHVTQTFWEGQEAYLINLRDITDRKEAENKIKKFTIIVEQSPCSVLITNRFGVIEYVNPMFCNVSGYTFHESVGKTPRILKSGHHSPSFYKNLWNTILNGEIWKGEICNRKKNGELYWDMHSISPMKNSDGEITHFISIRMENTDKKRLEEELSMHRNHLQELVDQKTSELQKSNANLARALQEELAIYSANPDILYAADTRARLTKWNKRLEKVTGYSPDELKGKESVSFFPSEETEVVTNAIQKVFTEGKAEIEAHLLTKSGKTIAYHFNGVLLKNENNEVIGITGTGRDISERKRAEEALRQTQKQLLHLEKLSALGKLTASIAHEFNNPLFGIRNVIEQAHEELAHNDQFTPLLNLALKECDRMAEMIRKLQGFYKPSPEVLSLVNIHSILDDVCLLAKKKFQERRILLKRNYHDNLPLIDAVEDQLKQVFLNIISNADEAFPPDIAGNPEKSKVITMSTQVDSDNIIVSIQDNGEGIPPENINTVFEPFFTTKAIKGTGLGLYISYGIIKKHGGHIELKSELGKGTTFNVSLPHKSSAPI